MTKSPKYYAPLKAYAPYEMADIYGINRKTFCKWLKPHMNRIGIRTGRFFNFRQVRIIFELLGPPNPKKKKINKGCSLDILFPFISLYFSDILEAFSFFYC